MSSDSYSILNLNPNEATIEEVKRAYRQFTLLYHPDKCGGDSTYFTRVKDAYREIMLTKTGQNSCFTHTEFRDGFKNFSVKQDREKDAKTKMIHEERDAKVVDVKEKTDIINLSDDFNLNKFNQMFEASNGKGQIFDSGVPKEQLVEEYKSFKSNTENVFLNARNSDNFLDTFNNQFEHINKKEIESRKTSLTEFGKDPVPFIGQSGSSFCDVKSKPEKNNELWGQGLENYEYAPLDQVEVMAQNPETKQLLDKKKCRKLELAKERIKDDKDKNLESKLQKIKSLRETITPKITGSTQYPKLVGPSNNTTNSS